METTRKNLESSECHQNTQKTITEQINDNDVYTLYEISEDPNTSIEMLEGIWNNRNLEKISSDILCGLAGNRNTPVKILECIWKNKNEKKINYRVIAEVAKNKNTPIQLLKEIWGNKNEEKINYIMCYLASNKYTPVEILKEIFEKAQELGNNFVYISLSKNKNIPVEILEKIWNNKDNWKINSDIIYELAGNRNTLVTILNEIYKNEVKKDNEIQIFSKLLKNPSTSTEILKKTYSKKEKYDHRIFSGLAKNPILSKNIFFSLSFQMLKETQFFPHVLNPYSSKFQVDHYKTLAETYLKNQKNKTIIDFLISNCGNIRSKLQLEDRKNLLATLKEQPKEELPLIFSELEKINKENPEKLTLDEINSRIENSLEEPKEKRKKNNTFVSRLCENRKNITNCDRNMMN